MEESPADPSNIQLKEVASDPFTGDKETLIENGGTPGDGATNGRAMAQLQMDTASSKLSVEKKKTARGLQVIVISSIVFAVSVTIALIVTIYCAPPQVARHGAVSCDDTRCSEIGAELMEKDGGSAVDAAIATMFCLSVVQPESSGLGGGGYMVSRQHKDKKSTVIAFRETAAQNVDAAELAKPEDQIAPGATVGVPGAGKGLWEAHKRFGKLKWKKLVEPSIKMAREGYRVNRNSAEKLANFVPCNTSSALSDMFCTDGQVPQEGDIVKRKEYANLLEKIAEDGIDDLYKGETAKQIIDTVNNAGGTMTMDDLKNYDVIVDKPITSTYHGMSIESVDVGAGGGPFILMLLNVLNEYQPKRVNKTQLFHILIEAQKFAYEAGNNLGDAAFNTNVTKLIDQYISKDFAKELYNAISPNSTLPLATYSDVINSGSQSRRRRATHTTHVSVIGPNEDHVSITNSLNSNFGSKLVTPSGLILNNVLLDFNTQDALSPNKPEGGKRPQSHMSPVVAHSKERPCGLRLAAGAAGSAYIPADVATVLMYYLALDEDIKDAVDSPRLIVDSSNYTVVEYNSNLESNIVDGLKEKGHVMEGVADIEALKLGVCNVALKVNETVSAAADPIRADTPDKTGEVVF